MNTCLASFSTSGILSVSSTSIMTPMLISSLGSIGMSWSSYLSSSGYTICEKCSRDLILETLKIVLWLNLYLAMPHIFRHFKGTDCPRSYTQFPPYLQALTYWNRISSPISSAVLWIPIFMDNWTSIFPTSTIRDLYLKKLLSLWSSVVSMMKGILLDMLLVFWIMPAASFSGKHLPYWFKSSCICTLGSGHLNDFGFWNLRLDFLNLNENSV